MKKTFLYFILIIFVSCGSKNTNAQNQISEQTDTIYQQINDTIKVIIIDNDTTWDNYWTQYKVDTTDVLNDTTFIYRRLGQAPHKIYIETNRKSKFYKNLDYIFDKKKNYRFEYYFERKQELLKENKDTFKVQKDFDLPEKWLPLYQFKDELYLYKPCDGMSLWGLLFNKMEYVYLFCEGATPVPYISFKKQSANEYVFEVQNIYLSDEEIRRVNIEIIDEQSKLTLFYFSDEDFFQFYIPLENAYLFDMIINESRNKEMEYEFKPTDVEKMKLKYKNLSKL